MSQSAIRLVFWSMMAAAALRTAPAAGLRGLSAARRPMSGLPPGPGLRQQGLPRLSSRPGKSTASYSIRAATPDRHASHPTHITVRRGDSLSSISQTHGCSMDDLLRHNKSISPADIIFPGDKLLLPPPHLSSPQPPAASEPPSRSQVASQLVTPEASSAWFSKRASALLTVVSLMIAIGFVFWKWGAIMENQRIKAQRISGAAGAGSPDAQVKKVKVYICGQQPVEMAGPISAEELVKAAEKLAGAPGIIYSLEDPSIKYGPKSLTSIERGSYAFSATKKLEVDDPSRPWQRDLAALESSIKAALAGQRAMIKSDIEDGLQKAAAITVHRMRFRRSIYLIYFCYPWFRGLGSLGAWVFGIQIWGEHVDNVAGSLKDAVAPTVNADQLYDRIEGSS